MPGQHVDGRSGSMKIHAEFRFRSPEDRADHPGVRS